MEDFFVICPEHGRVALTEEQYEEQMIDVDALWKCPLCGKESTEIDFEEEDDSKEVEAEDGTIRPLDFDGESGPVEDEEDEEEAL